MKYIFKEGKVQGEYPIDYFRICWYDMEENESCYDETWVNPENFSSKYFTYIDTEEDEDCIDRSRIFAHHKNGDIYELRLHKLTKEQWQECSKFNGGRAVIK